MPASETPLGRSIFTGNWKATISSAGPASQDYVALPIQNLIPGQEVPFELMVRIKIAGKGREKFEGFCASGQTVEPALMAKLQEAGINRLYFHQRDQALVLAYLHQNLQAVLNDPQRPVRERAERLADITYFWMQQCFSGPQGQLAPKLVQGFTYVEHFLKFIHQDHYQCNWLVDLCRHDQDLYSHCLNTCLLAMAFARHLGWQERNIREVGRGALLHDIGMTRITPEILKKTAKLSPEEEDLVKKHPTTGFLMLKTLSLMSREALLLVLQHHENGDGSGYPEGIKLAKIHPLARMMRIVDSFESLVSRRAWRPAFPPRTALWIMRRDWQEKGIYDVGLLVEFIRFMAMEKEEG
jgi:putative nucleotidyltransferase with HDIG domain